MSGGISATRGYLYQYLICILDSLTEDWISVVIEPNTEQEKVDILWLLIKNGKIFRKAVQVKSTQNQFGTGSVKKCSEDLKNSFNDAEVYELILIGHVSRTLIEDISKLEQKYLVKIPYPKVFDLEFFLSQDCHKIDKYIDENYGISLPCHQREELIYSLIGELQYYSTNRRKITRKDLEAKFQEWIKYFIDYTNYEREASRKFYNLYGFEASPNLRIAVEKFYKNKSKKVKMKFFKECQSFFDVELSTKKLKIVYPKFDKIFYYIGNILFIATTLLALLCLILANYFDFIFIILFFVFSFLSVGILPLIRPYHWAKIIDRELK
ncbi:hypothetical protein [Chroococcus sp. FPU101]|uniref:hypothetical protein n=1 Tax=Chroococcus sp. FPU101 TaxID=1974212 RepID=UPI001A8C306F|nr:hypothetical protein [Chroococcus sp. FPU101]GFE70275.1 hypothetical protein CFPU101_28850 [Chroococcus sp. FPU101]